MKVVRVCAWCGRVLGVTEWPGSGSATTHGVCVPCQVRLRERLQTATRHET